MTGTAEQPYSVGAAVHTRCARALGGLVESSLEMDEELKQALTLGREHYERHDYDRAEPLLRRVLAKTDRYADVYNMMAVILHERCDFIGAERYFERAVELNPHYTEALLNLSVTYNDLGKYEAARQVYSQIHRSESGGGLTALDPYALGKIANMHADLAQAYHDAGFSAEAIAELEKAVHLCPQFADLQVRLGALYRDAGQLAQARDRFAAACDANPDYAVARVMLGVTLLSLGSPSAAIAEWRRALASDPENKNAKMYLRMVEAQQRARQSEHGSDET